MIPQAETRVNTGQLHQTERSETYIWKDELRRERWMRLALARHAPRQRAILGREAAMRLLGRQALTGHAGRGWEQAYDLLYPLYDPALELLELDVHFVNPMPVHSGLDKV